MSSHHPQRCKHALWGMALVLLSTCGPAAAEEKRPQPTKAQLQQLYVAYLSAEGYRPEVDDDGDVSFKSEGRSYFIGVDDKDSSFFRVCLPNIWTIESTEERAKVLAAADFATGDTKVSKIFTVSSYKNVWACTELFVARPEDFKGVFNRGMSALQHAREAFVNKMNE
jgi:hypothetical protein